MLLHLLAGYVLFLADINFSAGNLFARYRFEKQCDSWLKKVYSAVILSLDGRRRKLSKYVVC